MNITLEKTGSLKDTGLGKQFTPTNTPTGIKQDSEKNI